MKIERTKLFGLSIPENRSSVIERPVSDFKTRWIVGACESDDRGRTSGGGVTYRLCQWTDIAASLLLVTGRLGSAHMYASG